MIPTLTLGAVNLMAPATDLEDLGYRIEALATDADWGNAAPITQVIESWLQEGAIVAAEGHENRQMFLRVEITSTTDAGLTTAEAALFGELEQRNELVWTPPRADAEPCVFTVVMSHLEFEYDDLDELDDIRAYGIRIIAEPFVHATYTLTSVAIPEFNPGSGEDPETTTLDDGTSTTDWAMVPVRSGSVTTVSGMVRLSTTTTLAEATQGLYRDEIGGDLGGMVYVAAKVPFAQADVSPRWTGHIVPPPYKLTQSVRYFLNGVQVTPAFKIGDELYFSVTGLGGALETFEVRVNGKHTGPIGPNGYGLRFTIAVDQIRVTNTITADGSDGRQVSGIIEVAGSAPTIGNLAVEYPLPADFEAGEYYPLGETLVYTCGDDAPGYWPGLREYAVGSPTETPDAALIADSWISLAEGAGAGPVRFEYPVAQIPPGGFALVGRVRRGTNGASVITIRTGVTNGVNDVGPVYETTWSGDLTTNWEFVVLGVLMLPFTQVGSAGTVWVELSSETADTVRLDEGWLFNLEGQLTHLKLPATGTDGPSRLWLNAPSVANPAPQVLVGNQEDASDAYHPGDLIKSYGVHKFEPPRTKVVVISTGDGSGVPRVTLTHQPRFHTHVTPPPSDPPPPPRVGLVQAIDSIDTWTYPDEAIDGDMLIACGFIANDAVVTANGWDLLDDSLGVPGVDYRPVVYTKPYDGTTTMPTVAGAALDHLLISGTYAEVTNTDVAGSFASIGDSITAPGVATEKLSLFGAVAPVFEIDEFTLSHCTLAARADAPADHPALLELTVKLSSGSAQAEQPDPGVDHDVNWFAVSIGLS